MAREAFFGQYEIQGADWEQLPRAGTSFTEGIVLKARASNGSAVELAKDEETGETAAVDGFTPRTQLDAGEAVVIPIMSLNEVAVKGTAGDIIDVYGASAYS